jgi:hypothetical protein
MQRDAQKLTGPDLEQLAAELRSTLEQVLAQAGRQDWSAASRSVLDLVHASRRIENEVDFQYTNEWLDKARSAVDEPATPPRAAPREA